MYVLTDIYMICVCVDRYIISLIISNSCICEMLHKISRNLTMKEIESYDAPSFNHFL